jgi:hypothetical protein
MATRAPWWERLNNLLLPRIGPPPLGPYNEAPLPPTGPKPCPICGNPMDEHIVERSPVGDARTATRLRCPARSAVPVVPVPPVLPASADGVTPPA